MDKTKLIKKLALYVAYALFAGFSAYFTATSLSLSLLHSDTIWMLIVVFVLVFIIAIMAGWCLTNVITEFQKKHGASKLKFIFSIIGFLLFWLVSFTTNVHYFFIEKHGMSIFGQELTAAKQYIIENTDKSNRAIEEKKNTEKSLIEAQVGNSIDLFQREINNTLNHHIGFGDACITILNGTEDMLKTSNKIYNDKNDYIIYDDIRDAGDRGTTQRTKINALYTKYSVRMLDQLNKKFSVIEHYYELQKNQNQELLTILKSITNIEKNHYPRVEEDGSANAYFKCQQYQQHNVIDKMPQDFRDQCVEYNSNGKIAKINVYPSSRMFETATVWGDMFGHRLPDNMPMAQWILISLIFDIMAFLLFALAKSIH